MFTPAQSKRWKRRQTEPDHRRALIKHSSSAHTVRQSGLAPQEYFSDVRFYGSPRRKHRALHPDRAAVALFVAYGSLVPLGFAPAPTPGRHSRTRPGCRSGSVRAPTGWRTCCLPGASPGSLPGPVWTSRLSILGPHPAARLRARRDPRPRGRDRIPAAVLPPRTVSRNDLLAGARHRLRHAPLVPAAGPLLAAMWRRFIDGGTQACAPCWAVRTWATSPRAVSYDFLVSMDAAVKLARHFAPGQPGWFARPVPGPAFACGIQAAGRGRPDDSLRHPARSVCATTPRGIPGMAAAGLGCGRPRQRGDQAVQVASRPERHGASRCSPRSGTLWGSVTRSSREYGAGLSYSATTPAARGAVALVRLARPWCWRRTAYPRPDP